MISPPTCSAEIGLVYQGRPAGYSYTVSLNIKNEETHQLVRRLAELTGQSQTSAVEDAVRRRIAQLEWEQGRQARSEAAMRIARRAAASADPTVSNDPNDFLYDEAGLPR